MKNSSETTSSFFRLQQGLEIHCFWFQKKTVQRKTVLREVYTYVVKWIFFSKNRVTSRFLFKIRVSQVLLEPFYTMVVLYLYLVHKDDSLMTLWWLWWLSDDSNDSLISLWWFSDESLMNLWWLYDDSHDWWLWWLLPEDSLMTL